jgi:hypothetical protein
LQLDEADIEMRRRAVALFSQDVDVLLHLLNAFMFWRGDLINDAQVALHNAAEHYVAFLMGPPTPPPKMDRRWLEQLEVLIGDQPLAQRMSGASQSAHDKPRRKRKVNNDV